MTYTGHEGVEKEVWALTVMCLHSTLGLVTGLPGGEKTWIQAQNEVFCVEVEQGCWFKEKSLL